MLTLFTGDVNTNFMLLSARLAVMTGNKTYGDWADKTWDWLERVQLISSTNYTVYTAVPWIPGTEFVPSAHFDLQSSINGAAASAAAHMYNVVRAPVFRFTSSMLTQRLPRPTVTPSGRSASRASYPR